jgi:hypothetical protein
MASPFPGMDPYLEDPALWPGLHNKIIYNLVAALNDALPEDYVADMEQRLYISHSSHLIVPDVAALRLPERAGISASRGGAAVVSRADEPSILIAGPEEISETFVEIRHLTEPKRVVTVIEVISHTNKTSGGEGRKSYLDKQREVLSSDIHLVEIDLLRNGRHVAAPPYDRIAVELGFRDYLISVSRSPDRTRYELYLRTVRETLPCIRVPLTNGDADVAVDMQAIFERCYSDGAYDRLVDYRRDPFFPLNEPDAAWATALLVAKGLRPDRIGAG